MKCRIGKSPRWIRVFLWSVQGVLKGEYCEVEENFWRWLAFRVSKHLVYWATLRLMINSPNGKYSGQVVPNISTYEAMNKWCRSRMDEGYYK